MLPDLKELATFCKDERDFPADLKKKKVAAVEAAIAAAEAATDQPELRSIAPLLEKAGAK